MNFEALASESTNINEGGVNVTRIGLGPLHVMYLRTSTYSLDRSGQVNMKSSGLSFVLIRLNSEKCRS